MWIRTAALFALAASSLAAANSSDDFYQAIRTNDLAKLKAMIGGGFDINVKDRHGATPLMYSASVGSVGAMKMLLAAGADAKVKNAFDATPLMWCTANIEKSRLLMDAGVDVNAKSKQGMTALLIAASNAGSIDVVRLLMAKGAALTGGKFTPLLAAASANDLDMVRLFIEKGVDANQATPNGYTPLQLAAGAENLAMVKLLLAKGADVNAATMGALEVRKGPLALNHLTPLMDAAPYGTPELLRTLLDAGAQVNAKDIRDMTPMMQAVSSETQNPDVVRLLLEKGADVRAKSNDGETALDWAKKFGNPEVIGLLQKAGGETGQKAETARVEAAPAANAKAAIEKSVALMQTSSTAFFKESGCVGCHHQNFTAMAVKAARRAGVHVDEAAAEEQLKVVKTQWMGRQEELLQRLDPGGASDALVYSLVGLAAAGQPADATTDAMIVNIALEQTPEGSWCIGGTARSPIEEGCTGRTALAIRVMQLYGPPGLKAEYDKRMARARDYLLESKPKTTDDSAMLLLGWKWDGMSEEKVAAAARSLVALQRADGGWAGNTYLESDAYSTGEALYALHETGALSVHDAVYQRGTAYLLKTQQADGSWHVKSRAVKFQPYFQSGFPYDHDQWISAAGTAWATVALANGIEMAERASR